MCFEFSFDSVFEDITSRLMIYHQQGYDLYEFYIKRDLDYAEYTIMAKRRYMCKISYNVDRWNAFAATHTEKNNHSYSLLILLFSV